MPDRTFPALDALVRHVEETATNQLDPVAVLVAMLKLVVASDADPYLLVGALIEGVAASIAQKIPPERQSDVAIEAVRLLRDRLGAHLFTRGD
jgi:hypothetical protein